MEIFTVYPLVVLSFRNIIYTHYYNEWEFVMQENNNGWLISCFLYNIGIS